MSPNELPAMQQNESSALWRTQLLSLISHEIRTPLTTIIAFSQTLQSDDEDISDDERKYYLSIIEKEGKRISRFLGDLIEITHIESSHEYLNYSKTNYSDLIQSAVQAFKGHHDISINVSISGKSVIATIDSRRMYTALDVLLSYMARENTQHLELSVVTRGTTILTTLQRTSGAISEKEIHNLFDINSQLLLTKTSSSIKNEPVYAASIIRAHQGQIWVISSPETGVRISFELPGF
jgi:K+-sensing histidine kinase KdpD